MSNPDPRTDQELIAAINTGDAEAFDALYYRHRDWIIRIARRFSRTDQDALDILQETCVYLLGRFPGFVLSARLTTFLYPVIKNLAIDRHRKLSRETTGADFDRLPALPSPPDASVERAELSKVIAALPVDQREVLLLRFVDDLSMIEIATVLKIPEGTVKSRLHNAIKALRSDPRLRSRFLP